MCFLCVLAAGGTVAWKQRNVTIDDKHGDEVTGIAPKYLPSHAWSSGPRDGLNAKPNASLAYNGIWHDSTHWVNNDQIIVNFGFTGLYNHIRRTHTYTGPFFDAFANYHILLDGVFVGEYRHDVEMIPDYFYNVPVYVNTTMQNEFHNLSLVANSTERAVLLLFDYATYTVVEEDPVVASTSTDTAAPTSCSLLPTTDQPTGNSQTQIEVIVQVGAALGILAFFVLVGAVIFHLNKKSRTPVLPGTTLRHISRVPRHLATFYRKIVRSLTSHPGESGGVVGDKSSVAQVRSQNKDDLNDLPPYSP
ncbi:hypothetical protein EYR38_008596 [Pleurotus pulmonarius]|nr:hypothetical protein EYR38_008596 [Pleurotus pulmonarius]